MNFNYRKAIELHTNYRYEKKIPLNQEDLQKFWFWFKQHGGDFREVYPPRIVNNIYFDTPHYRNYYDKEDGVSYRAKSRLRWYSDEVPKDPVSAYGIYKYAIKKPESYRFEIKVRTNAVGFKHVQTIKSEKLEIEPIKTLYNRLRKVLKPKYKVVLDETHMPVIFNMYIREYYSTKENIRLTVDRGNKYSRINNGNKLPYKLVRSKMSAVIEIKYSEEQLKKTDFLFKDFPFKTYKNSKYVDAIECTSLH